MSDLVGNPEDRFSRVAAQVIVVHLFNQTEPWVCIVTTQPRSASLDTFMINSQSLE